MLIGEYQHNIDPKGRVIVPVRFREDLGEHFYITKGLDGCLFVLSLQEWTRLQDKVEAMPISKARGLQRFFFSGAAEVEPDKQGRILIPQSLRDHGPNKLQGEILIHGAKNSTLPLMAASLLCEGQCILHNCPILSDVETSLKILRYLGCRIERSGSDVVIDPTSAINYEIPDNLMREMRSSIVFLGAIVSCMAKAKLSFPGGCELGPRPIDLHLLALRKMGVVINEDHAIV